MFAKQLGGNGGDRDKSHRTGGFNSRMRRHRPIVADCNGSSVGNSNSTASGPPSTSQLVDEFAAIAVAPHLKEHMQSRWEMVLRLTEQSQFPDVDGFATANSATRPLPLGYGDE